MTDQPPPPPPRKRRIPLRWITLGEAVAVAAVIVSALGLWNSYNERQQDIAATHDTKPAPARPLVLRASIEDKGDRLSLGPVAEGLVIQGQTITFPDKLGVSPVETTGDSRIEAGWFTSALVKARHKADRPDETAGDERLAVLIDTQYLDGDKTLRDHAVYDIGYAVEAGGFFSGSKVLLRGVSLVARGDGAARINALWDQRMKPKAK